MKVLVFLALLLACTQADTDMMKKAAEAVSQCVTEKGLNLEKISGILQNNPLPEDNDEFTTFFTCYYTKLGLLKDDEIDLEKIKSAFPQLIKQNFGDNIDADKLAKAAMDHCEATPKGSSGTITAIKIRNCAITYVKEHHHEHHHH